jgi:predicted DNA-binding transcriptional regulator AlpA
MAGRHLWAVAELHDDIDLTGQPWYFSPETTGSYDGLTAEDIEIGGLGVVSRSAQPGLQPVRFLTGRVARRSNWGTGVGPLEMGILDNAAGATRGTSSLRTTPARARQQEAGLQCPAPQNSATLAPGEAPDGASTAIIGLPRLLSRAEVEQMLCVSRKTLWRLVQRGTLPAVYLDRRPRFLPEDVWAFVLSRRRRGGVSE